MNETGYVKDRIERPSGRRAPLSLIELRESLRLTRAQVGAALGISDVAIRRQELSHDIRISTLSSYVDGLGRASDRDARLVLSADIAGERAELQLAADPATSPAEGERQAWKLRAHDDRRIQDELRSQNVITVGADDMPDLSSNPAPAEVEALLRRSHPETTDKGIAIFQRYWRYFMHELQVGDLVLVPLVDSEFAIAEVAGEYEYDDSPDEPRLWHRRFVHWRCWGQRRSDLPDDLKAVANSQGTINRIRKPEATARLRRYPSARV
ncbi:MAG: hypothetical protein OEW42_13650 [Acidimicrobiia bacterium]|nr:hypothetical protein [Acidimicrobiia bacterium]